MEGMSLFRQLIVTVTWFSLGSLFSFQGHIIIFIFELEMSHG